jgi:enoyl-CoA hydratase
MENVRLERDGTTAVITIDRPKALNALNAQTVNELKACLEQIAQSSDVRAVIVTGGGEKAFVAGADIAEMANYTVDQALAFAEAGHNAMALFESLKVPTIAAVNGFALGGGCELALACDFIYASSKAKLGLPEVSLGVIPGFGGTQRLTRLVGRARAKELIFTGDAIDANKAKDIGLVLEVLAPEELMAHCKKVAANIAKRGPIAVAKAKSIIDEGSDESLALGNAMERGAFADLFSTEDQKEGMRAFLQKRNAVFGGK